jgi:hypothetical protein
MQNDLPARASWRGLATAPRLGAEVSRGAGDLRSAGRRGQETCAERVPSVWTCAERGFGHTPRVSLDFGGSAVRELPIPGHLPGPIDHNGGPEWFPTAQSPSLSRRQGLVFPQTLPYNQVIGERAC